MTRKISLGFESLENKSVLSAVAILDSGLDINHKDLIDNVWTNPYEIANDNIDNDNNGYIDDIHGWNFIDNNNNVLDVYGHGTHVGGIVQGVAPSVSIIVIKIISDTGVGSTSALLNGLDYVHKLKIEGVDIGTVNASWTLGSYGSLVVRDLIQTLDSDDIVFVCAAGNNGQNLDIYPNYPSSYKLGNIVSVASITPDGTLAGSSNYGANTVTIATYGTLIYSTWPGNRYATLSGTSMAAPFVSGKMSLLSGAVSERVFKLLGEVTKTEILSGKVISGGFVNVNSNFLSPPVAVTPPAPPVVPVQVTILRVGLYSISGIVNKQTGLSIYVNERFVGRARVVYDTKSESYKFSYALNRRYFNRGWNEVSVRDSVSGIKLSQKMIKRIV